MGKPRNPLGRRVAWRSGEGQGTPRRGNPWKVPRHLRPPSRSGMSTFKSGISNFKSGMSNLPDPADGRMTSGVEEDSGHSRLPGPPQLLPVPGCRPSPGPPSEQERGRDPGQRYPTDLDGNRDGKASAHHRHLHNEGELGGAGAQGREGRHAALGAHPLHLPAPWGRPAGWRAGLEPGEAPGAWGSVGQPCPCPSPGLPLQVGSPTLNVSCGLPGSMGDRAVKDPFQEDGPWTFEVGDGLAWRCSW